MSTKCVTYFAFGSNLLTKRININCPSAVRIDVGKLKGFKLHFSNNSERWHGAIASITEKADSYVYGILWKICMEELPHLDRQEGVHLEQYKPIEVEVETLNSGVQKARTYQLVSPNCEYIMPSWVYLDVIIRGAIENGIPEDYVKKLKKIEHNGYKGSVDINL